MDRENLDKIAKSGVYFRHTRHLSKQNLIVPSDVLPATSTFSLTFSLTSPFVLVDDASLL